jgi:transaldolase
MRLFLDTASVEEIEQAVSLGVVSGVTTNPSLFAAQGRVDAEVFERVVKRICALVDGPVSAEVVSTDAEGMVREALRIAPWAPNVVVKIPTTAEGLKALSALRRHRVLVECADCDAGRPCLRHPNGREETPIQTNATLIFSPNQALLAALAGATYVSPFVGRLDDAGHDGMAVVAEIVEIFERQRIPSYVLAASIRHPLHVVQAAKAGAHCCTMPFKVLMQMVKHPLTDVGLDRFLKDWERATGSPVGAR